MDWASLLSGIEFELIRFTMLVAFTLAVAGVVMAGEWLIARGKRRTSKT